MTTDRIGERTAVGNSYRPSTAEVADRLIRWLWLRFPTLANGGHAWRDGLLRIEGDCYRLDAEHRSDDAGRCWTTVELTKVCDGTVRTVEIAPNGAASCVRCRAKEFHPWLRCRHEAVVPEAVTEFDRECQRVARAGEALAAEALQFDF